MKKMFRITIAVLLIMGLLFSSPCVYVFAIEKTNAYGNTYTVMTADGPKSMINNKYYEIYFDRIFETEYSSLSNYSLSEMTQSVIEQMADNELYYITVILNEKTTSETYAEYNKQILNESDIVYLGTTTPVSVVKLNKNDALRLIGNEKVSAFFPAFFSAKPLVNFVVGSGIMGDADFSSEITSADARKILRYSAGLIQIDDNDAKRFYFQSDINFDGNITAADARLALRTAAKLCEKNEISLSYADYWNDF